MSTITKLMNDSDKLKIMIKKFGIQEACEYIDNAKNISRAFKQSLYAEFVYDSWLNNIKEIVK